MTEDNISELSLKERVISATLAFVLMFFFSGACMLFVRYGIETKSQYSLWPFVTVCLVISALTALITWWVQKPWNPSEDPTT